MTDKWKIVRTDNFNREHVPDRLVADGITSESEGRTMVKALQATCTEYDQDWYVLVPEDYVLKRGMEDMA